MNRPPHPSKSAGARVTQSRHQDFYVEKIRVLTAGLCSNILAWNNRIGRYGSILLVSRTIVMINRDGRGHQYSVVRGEILRFTED